ncbi:LLM class flavin-dependent oxidoreductase [Halieaceae bacterium IMCC14734]|uniref:LLM class flavin-dependent oxidoreductase n=1 Tax=Candidatus Litorirhabdus singularis TaxID=2518993 RepID=A0ABT3THV4_9GAMM|nr:LLM class flavin-dependent oxidoreductase [Candidatus Litorirhabdus singularis]MCX2981908.1 LLM class flavin-dependent oxidoreductase [Candidatus Litorirhabdus singularis]
MSQVVMRFDMRCPANGDSSAADLYQAVLDMSEWGDTRGIDVIGLSEHHNTTDGFLPSPLNLASAIAARTRHALLSIGALLVPLHDPLRLAEDIAVLDLLSRGRLTVITGIGYREQEYLALGRDWKRRGQLLEENIKVMQQAWTGMPFDYRGTSVQVLPRPYSLPHPLLAIGGNSAPAARRAARLRLPFFPAIDDAELVKIYREACTEQDFSGGLVILPGYPTTTFLAEDVELGWQQIGRYMLYDALAYGSWRHATRRAYAESFAADLETLRAEGKYAVLTPAEALAKLRAGGSLHLAPLVGGAPPELGWQSLRLFAEQVAPQLHSD